jgi:hypothetical protein
LFSAGRAAQCVGTKAVVDDDRADQHVVQKPAAVVEEGQSPASCSIADARSATDGRTIKLKGSCIIRASFSRQCQ